ncbi:adenylate/guanylate cyclase domain-containing protein [Ruegeria arenilitoris]|uniref:adenylate/guanylate cyclase domain-containing protein n=1 Tax=Ruegeria arenilitoris TaxID=1173585 RepID=UPI001480CBEB|nr:adenylate/guanylate cyclase domain-containing protein [Ruegeria arenilitoris]
MQNVAQLNAWLVSDGRMLGDETQIISRYCHALTELGVPLSRVRIGQSYANPLISAWGMIWTPDRARKYTVPSGVLATSSWQGSPFQHVVDTRTCLRKRILDLDLTVQHEVYAELAEGGVTDFFAIPLEYGDGSVQGSSFCTDDAGGFSDAHLAAIESTRHALAAALEPIAMRESQQSLLRTYLGDGPAREIGNRHFKRGEHRAVSAAILFADLRGFTAKSETWPETELLAMMGDYFEMVVTPIHQQGGDVLKFMGDGVLAIFEASDDAQIACAAAVKAATESLDNLRDYNAAAGRRGEDAIEFVIGIDYGAVTFGNIGSPDRLDFTVVGPAVNIASRVQGLCKELGESLLVSSNVAGHVRPLVQTIGEHQVKGLGQEIEIFRVSSQPG